MSQKAGSSTHVSPPPRPAFERAAGEPEAGEVHRFARSKEEFKGVSTKPAARELAKASIFVQPSSDTPLRRKKQGRVFLRIS